MPSNDNYTSIPYSLPELKASEHRELAQAFYQRLSSRRTIREFSDKPIPDGVLENLILTAGSAPNGANLQPWHFAVVRDPALKRKIRVAAEEEEAAFYSGRAPDEWLEVLAPLGTDQDKPFLEVAPALIAIFTKSKVTTLDGKESKTYYSKESTGIATGFLIAALHEAGLASLTHTPSPMKFLNEILGRPAEEKPFLLLVVGYPAEDCMVPAIERLPLEKIASFQ
jgi:nitroreductase